MVNLDLFIVRERCTDVITILAIPCIDCEQVVVIEAPFDGLARLRAGMCIQEALPTLTADEREIMISQICGSCFDKIYDEVFQ